MAHEFVILVDGVVKTFTRIEDIPARFDNIIKFNPDVPDPPHSEEQHLEIESWHAKFLELMERETNGG